MDLHLTGARATAEERAAVDSELGAPESVWQGGERRSRRCPGRLSAAATKPTAAASAAARTACASKTASAGSARAPSTMPRCGWTSPPAEVYGVASFYGMFSLEPRPAVVAHVCDDIACMTQGLGRTLCELERALGAGSPCSGGRAMWLRSHCLGLCERAPAALVTRPAKNRRNACWRRRRRKPCIFVTDAVQRSCCPPNQTSERSDFCAAGGSKNCRLLRRVAKATPATWKPTSDWAAMRLCARPWSLARKACCVSDRIGCWAAAARLFPRQEMGSASPAARSAQSKTGHIT